MIILTDNNIYQMLKKYLHEHSYLDISIDESEGELRQYSIVLVQMLNEVLMEEFLEPPEAGGIQDDAKS